MSDRSALSAPSEDVLTGRGRYVRCPCCRSRLHVAPGQVWEEMQPVGSPRHQVRIISCERDGAIIEVLTGPMSGERRGWSYSSMLSDYREVRDV